MKNKFTPHTPENNYDNIENLSTSADLTDEIDKLYQIVFEEYRQGYLYCYNPNIFKYLTKDKFTEYMMDHLSNKK